MSEMWERESSAFKREKQARVFIHNSFRRVLYRMGVCQMVHRANVVHLLRLVDGYRSCFPEKGSCVAVQKVVLWPCANMLLPRLRAQF